MASVRQTSSWASWANICDVLRRLAEAVGPWTDRYQPILLLDCATSHVHWRVACTAAGLGIWLVYVLILLTWLVQPCGTLPRWIRLLLHIKSIPCSQGLVASNQFDRSCQITFTSEKER